MALFPCCYTAISAGSPTCSLTQSQGLDTESQGLDTESQGLDTESQGLDTESASPSTDCMTPSVRQVGRSKISV